MTIRPKAHSLHEFLRQFPDEEACLAHYAAAQTATTRSLKGSDRFAGTMFQDSNITLHQWYLAMWHVCCSNVSLGLGFLSRMLAIDEFEALAMYDSIRLQMAAIDGKRRIGGKGAMVHIDEALFREIYAHRPGERRDTVVLGFADSENVVLGIIDERTQAAIYPVVEARVRRKSLLVTDGCNVYDGLVDRGWRRSIVNHSREYVNKDGISQARIETVWKSVRRSLRVTPGPISMDRFWLLLKEVEFKFNHASRIGRAFETLTMRFPDLSRKTALQRLVCWTP